MKLLTLIVPASVAATIVYVAVDVVSRVTEAIERAIQVTP